MKIRKRSTRPAKCPKCGAPIYIGLDGLRKHGHNNDTQTPNVRTTRYDRVNVSRIGVTSAGLPTLGKR